MTRTSVLVTLLCCLAAARAAADAELDSLRERVRTLEQLQQRTLAELDRLRERVDGGAPAVGATPPSPEPVGLEELSGAAGDQSRIDFHGHLTAAYYGFEERSLAPASDQSGSLSDLYPQSSFDVTDLSLFVGVPIGEALYAAAEIEYEFGGEEIDLDQAFIEWDLQREQRMAVRLGKFYAPFGIERFYQNAPRNPLVDRPSPYIHIVPGTYSETGIALLGERQLSGGPELELEYEFALMNGLGAELFDSAREARQVSDNNSSKAVGGRLGLEWDRWLQVGTSALVGDYDDSDEDRFRFVGVDARATWGPLALRGEYVYSHVDRPDLIDSLGTPCSDARPLCPGLVPPFEFLGGSLVRRGWYAEAVWSTRPGFTRLLDELQYVLRYDWLDEDDSITDLLDAQRLSAGLVLVPMPHFRMKLQYEVTDERDEEFDNNALLLEGSVDW
jgi:hypothetical protein